MDHPTRTALRDKATDSWRAVILYGLNTATYKIALGRCLADFVAQGKTQVRMEELASAFLDLYSDRLQDGKPQLGTPGRLTLMERLHARMSAGGLTRTEAVELTAKGAFGDVIPRFHTLGGVSTPMRFFEPTPDGLVLTDGAFEALDPFSSAPLLAELSGRWDLLEGAFLMQREPLDLANDAWRIYLESATERTSLTPLRPVLGGYQDGLCFYCWEPLEQNDVHVDHVIPRKFLCHDQPWNLVLAHGLCNLRKSDRLPSREHVDALIARNERLVSSNHPIRAKVVSQLGATAASRAAAIRKAYEDALSVFPYVWVGPRAASDGGLYARVLRGLDR